MLETPRPHAQGRFGEIIQRLTLPVLVAPMFLVSGPQMVIAAQRAGLLGAFPAPNTRTVDDLRAWMSEIDGAIGTGWAQNVVVHRSYKRLGAELDLIDEFQPDIVITALGGPRAVVSRVAAYGGTVLADVNSPDYARAALDQGAHGLALVCSGAGGHTGDYSVFAFLDEVRSFFDGPLTVGGGVSTGQAVRALQVYGADLVTLGTRFIAAEESLAADGYKDMLVDSSMSDLVVTRAFTGARASMLKPSIVAAGMDPAKLDETKVPDYSNPEDSGDAKMWKQIWSAGQGIGQVRAVAPLAEIADRLGTEYRDAVARERTARVYRGQEFALTQSTAM